MTRDQALQLLAMLEKSVELDVARFAKVPSNDLIAALMLRRELKDGLFDGQQDIGAKTNKKRRR